MLALEADKRVQGDPENVWHILTDSQIFAEAAPYVLRVESAGDVLSGVRRRVYDRNGNNWTEECKQYTARSHYTMHIDTRHYPLPVTALKRIMSMEQLQRNILIKIRYEYLPRYGPLGYLVDRYHIRPILTMFAGQLLDNLVKEIYLDNISTMITAQDILDSKGQIMSTITPETPAADACQILTKARTGCLVVVGIEKDVVGILSGRDIVNALVQADNTPIMHRPVRDFMTHKVISCLPGDCVHEIISTMTSNHIKHLPVINDNEYLAGIISIDDVVGFGMAELERKYIAMHQYIEGRRWREMAMRIGCGATTEEFSEITSR